MHTFIASLIAVKCEADGAVVADGKHIIRQAVEPVTDADSIGAGDSFDAGFLSSWQQRLPLEERPHIACAWRRSLASQIGDLSGQFRWEDRKLSRPPSRNKLKGKDE